VTLIRSNIIFLGLVTLMTAFYGLFDTMNRGPYSAHQWRQADCLSITQHYYQENLPFLEPEVHWRVGSNNTGKTISEFPLIYYSVGKLWQVFGKKYWIYRILNFLIVLLGLYYLKRLVKAILGSDFWSIFIPLFLFTSPILVYYSNNFLMNSSALGIALIASYHHYQFLIKSSYKHLVFASILFLVAGLLKITALLLFFGFGAILLYQIIWVDKAFKSRWKVLLPYLVTLIGIVGWYRFAGNYNANNVQIFLQGLLPIWELNSSQVAETWSLFHNYIFPEFFSIPVLFLLLLIFVYLIFYSRQLHKYYRALLMLVALGVLSYFLLFYQVFSGHDYYLLNSLIVVPLIVIVGLHYLKAHYPNLFSGKALKLFALLIFISSTYYCRIHTIIKYDVGSNWVRTSMHTTVENKENWQLYHWKYKRTFYDLETIEPYLNSIGITRDDQVISMPDSSINITLYLMNRRGWTDYGLGELDGAQRIEKARESGVKYLVVNDSDLLKESFIEPYIDQKIGQYGSIAIYNIEKPSLLQQTTNVMNKRVYAGR